MYENVFGYILETIEMNIGVNVHYIPTYRFSYYQELFDFDSKDVPITEEVFSKIVTLPLFPKMRDEDVEDVSNAVKKVIN